MNNHHLNGRAKRILRLISHDRIPFEKVRFGVVTSSTKSLAELLPGIVLSEWGRSMPNSATTVYRNLAGATSSQKGLYNAIMRGAFFPPGHNIDDPPNGKTAAMGTLGETLFRWLRRNQRHRRVLVDPPLPRTTSSGDIDLIEVHRKRNGRFYIIAWENKTSDGRASRLNSTVYDQIDSYPTQLYYAINNMAEREHGTDLTLKRFLRDSLVQVHDRGPDIRYGAFITFSIGDDRNSFAPDLHFHPAGTANGASNVAVSLAMPTFSAIRAALWADLHIQP